MKKEIILGLIACQSLAFAEVDVEKGYSGLEFDTNMAVLNSGNKLETPLFAKYSLMKINNDYLLKTLSEDNTDRENIYKLGYTLSSINDSKGNGLNLMYSYSPDFEKRIGLNLNYTDLNNEYGNIDTNGDYGQLNIFYNYKDYTNFTEFFITAYGGLAKEKESNTKIDSKFIGLYTRYSDIIDNYYYNFFPKIYVEADIKRLEEKEKINSKNEKYKNDSINAGIGTELQKVIFEENDLKVSVIPVVSYNHEFLGDKKYREDKDYFEQEGKIGFEVRAEYKETSKIFFKYDYKKSFSSSEDMNLVSAGVKIML